MVPERLSLVDATESALDAAAHLTAMDVAAVSALRALARKIDAWDRIVQFALEDVAESSGRPVVPANDNVSLPTYMKLCEQLGLTPSGRKSLDLKEVRSGGKLAAVRALKPREGSGAQTGAKAPVRMRSTARVHAAAPKADTTH